MLAYWLRIPYAIALVIVGLLVEESHLVAVPQLDPAVVLFIFLPPLLFDAAFRLDAEQLRHLVRPIVLLAVPGTLITARRGGAGARGALAATPGRGRPVRQRRGGHRSRGRGRRVPTARRPARARAGGGRGKPGQRRHGHHAVYDRRRHRPHRHGELGQARWSYSDARSWGGSSSGSCWASRSRGSRADRRPPDRDDAVDGARLWQLPRGAVAPRVGAAGLRRGRA